MGLVSLAAFLGAALIGLAAALTTALAWRACFPAGLHGRFWIGLLALSQEVLSVDEVQAFLRLYRRLGASVGGYLGRNLLFTALAVGAVVAWVALGLFGVHAWRDLHGGEVRAWSVDASRPVAFSPDGVLAFTVNGAKVSVPADASPRIAACSSPQACATAAMLGFRVIAAPAGRDTEPGPVFIRTGHGDRNPLWPYLSDLEAAFLLVFLLATPFGIARAARASGAEAGAAVMRQSDFAMVQINSQFEPILRRLGDLETSLVRDRLPPIDRPVFVTGLARSGTTTVLNALAASPELASHRYRDFPFLAVPLAWNRLQGSKPAPPAAERPHRDRIRINKDSPDAFEEPLWLSFFPARGGKPDRLTEATSNAEFERVFADHLRKIMHVRGKPRYVSKGNYNVARLEYLGRMFPEARFVVPIRAPVEHVGSLARQHAIFSAYAEADPRVPSYLAAAGHFEFGPQRRPIRIAPSSPGADAYSAGDDVTWYAAQWAEVYGHVARLKAADGDLSRRILVLRYEDLCARPLETLSEVCAFCEADQGAAASFAPFVSASESPPPTEIAARAGEIWAIVGDTARLFGYVPAREGVSVVA